MCILTDVVSVSGQCGINILTNPGFDTPIQPSNGNNILNSFTFNGWTMTGGIGFNIVQPNGSYGSGPDNAQDGSQYTEVAFGNGTVYQDFTIVNNGTNISYGGYFSSRTGAGWTTNIQIYTMPGNTLAASSNSITYTNEGTEVWLYATGTATLDAGTYRYVANIPDDANFDAAFVYVNCVLPIHLLSFSASLQNTNNAKLHWQIVNAEDGGKYELQRSTDGRNYTGVQSTNRKCFSYTIQLHRYCIKQWHLLLPFKNNR